MNKYIKPPAARQASGATRGFTPLRVLNDVGAILPITPSSSLPPTRERTVGLSGACWTVLGFAIVAYSLVFLMLFMVIHT